MFSRLLGLLSADMAIDLGTANTLVYVKGKGIAAPSAGRSPRSCCWPGRVRSRRGLAGILDISGITEALNKAIAGQYRRLDLQAAGRARRPRGGRGRSGPRGGVPGVHAARAQPVPLLAALRPWPASSWSMRSPSPATSISTTLRASWASTRSPTWRAGSASASAWTSICRASARGWSRTEHGNWQLAACPGRRARRSWSASARASCKRRRCSSRS